MNVYVRSDSNLALPLSIVEKNVRNNPGQMQRHQKLGQNFLLYLLLVPLIFSPFKVQ